MKVPLKEMVELWEREHQRAHDLEARVSEDKYEKLNDLRQAVEKDRSLFCTKEHAEAVKEIARDALAMAKRAQEIGQEVRAMLYLAGVGSMLALLAGIGALVVEMVGK